jgi:hypothetical protein
MSLQIQYELWRECNCNCTYCTLGFDNHKTENELKLQSMQTAIDEMKNFEPNEHQTVGFIGGEFFQGQLNTPEIKSKFMELIKVANDLLNNHIVKDLWLNASLLIGNQKDLYEAIDLIDDKTKLWILTSYDSIGRFHTPKMLETWQYHMKNIHNLYPEIKLNTTSILTGDFIEKYLNDNIDIKEFKATYHTNLFLKTTVKPGHLSHLSKQEINDKIGNFFPTQERFQEFLFTFYMREGAEEYHNLFSNDLRADEVRKNYNIDTKRNIKFIRDKQTLEETIDLIDEHIDNLSCGHSTIYQCYVNSDDCCICNKQEIGELF